MSQTDRFSVAELHRDRYARTAEASYQLKKIPLPCHGFGIRSKDDLQNFIRIRMNYETGHLGFCVTQLALSDSTFVELVKNIREEATKFKPTAKGEQLKMFSEKTLLAVEPSTEFTYFGHQKTFEKIQTSIETPQFLKDYVAELLAKKVELGVGSEQYRDWKADFFVNRWNRVVDDETLLRELVLQNYEGQRTSKADMLIPPTPPIVSEATFEAAKKIINFTSGIWSASTAAYLVLHSAVLRNDDLLAKVLDFYSATPLPILMLKIKDFEPMDPDRVDARSAFGEIQGRFCDIREKNRNKCTILLEGGKLTYPSLVRGFDIVTNGLSGRNKMGGGKRKKGLSPNPFSRYYVNKKMVFYQYEKMKEFAKGELKYTNNTHALQCRLPCCNEIKDIEGMTKSIWNNSVVRPHFALSMNEEATFISELIYKNQVQKTKDRLLQSELCILKNLIPDV